MNKSWNSLPSGAHPRSDLTWQLIDKFKQLISEGALGPGSKLPPERNLAKQLRVSRPSLRQALKVLTIMDVLSQRVGDGTYVNETATAVLQEPMEFLILLGNISHYELFEARLMMEPELAARAAERATAQDISTLQRILTSLEKCSVYDRTAVEFDLAFHAAIFDAAGNRICKMMFGIIQRQLLSSISRTSRLVDVSHTLAFHNQIFAAINRRQPEEARRMMKEHILDARRVLLESRTIKDETKVIRMGPLRISSKKKRMGSGS